MTNPWTSLPAVAALLLLLAPTARAQHPPAASMSGETGDVQLGAHAVPLLTDVRPILRGEGRTEGYLTQPTLFARAGVLDGRLRLSAALSLEPLTLERGELGAGAYGEGYVDRRHPHTYLHELMLTAEGRAGPIATSLALGRGFAPFGTDDPMMRPFVKFPVNHHLSQVLERLVVSGGVRAGALLIEVGTFNGTEPLGPGDLGSLDRFGDSWSGRLTLVPLEGVELQVSRARVESPEMPRGEGADQRKWSASARHRRSRAGSDLYLLAEWSRSTEAREGREGVSWEGILAEAELARAGWRPALRVERTERPEEERGFDPFRSPWPHPAIHLLGLTRWTTLAARLERDLSTRGVRAAPFGEASFSRVSETGGGIFDPAEFYGNKDIWTLNLGVRVGVGWHPERVGRYGVAVAEAVHP